MLSSRRRRRAIRLLHRLVDVGSIALDRLHVERPQEIVYSTRGHGCAGAQHQGHSEVADEHGGGAEVAQPVHSVHQIQLSADSCDCRLRRLRFRVAVPFRVAAPREVRVRPTPEIQQPTVRAEDDSQHE